MPRPSKSPRRQQTHQGAEQQRHHVDKGAQALVREERPDVHRVHLAVARIVLFFGCLQRQHRATVGTTAAAHNASTQQCQHAWQPTSESTGHRHTPTALTSHSGNSSQLTRAYTGCMMRTSRMDAKGRSERWYRPWQASTTSEMMAGSCNTLATPITPPARASTSARLSSTLRRNSWMRAFLAKLEYL